MIKVSEQFIYSVRQYLRISHTHFDAEISDLISAAQADLMNAGIIPSRVADETDPLIRRAITTYVKAEFGLDNPDAEKYRESYSMLKMHLMLSTEYITGV